MSVSEKQLRQLAYLDALGVQVWQARDMCFVANEVIGDGLVPQEMEPEIVAPKAEKSAVRLAPREALADVPDFGMPPLDAYSVADMPPDDFDESKYDDLPVVSQRPLTWEELQEKVESCTRCDLHCHRTHAVFGSGDVDADLMFISEAPSVDEDAEGMPLVGESGQLLDLIFKSVDIAREDVYLTNVVKCHPPDQRDLHVDELSACSEYLARQIELVNPRLIIAIGRVSAQKLLANKKNLAELRMQPHVYGESKIPVLVSYHPAYLLRSPQEKRKSWEDMLNVRDLLQSLSSTSV